MNSFMEPVTFRCPKDLNDRLEGERKRDGLEKSELIRKALEYYLNRDLRKQNMETILGCLDRMEGSFKTMTYEVVRTRAALLLRADMMHRELSAKERVELLEEGDKDAREYLEGQEKIAQ